MRRTTYIGLLLGGLLLAACQNSSGASASPGVPGGGTGAGGGGGAGNGGSDPGGGAANPAPTPTLSVLDSSGHPGPFAIGALDKLIVATDCANLKPGPHALRVAVTGPSGALYAQLPATVLVGDDGSAHTSSNLRVRGSTIEGYRQSGTWELVASVDGVQVAATSIDLIE